MSERTNLKMRVVTLLFLMGMMCTPAIGRTIYVDANTPDNNDGSSWAKAYKYLQDALADANASGDFNEIWVAQGIYKPDETQLTPNGSGERYATFELIDGVSLYGGFPTGGGSWDDRDPNIYETILSGDLNGDDQPGLVNFADNSLTITRISWRDGLTTLDGFTIKSSYDYALYNYLDGGGQMLIANCKFLEHRSYGFFLKHPDFTGPQNGRDIGTLTGTEIVSCIFQNNGDGSEWIVFLNGFSPIFKNCNFLYNTSWPVECDSFQMWPEDLVYSNPTFINSVFIGNVGAVHIEGECTSSFVNCIFVANDGAISQSGMSGGGLTTLINCTITNNTIGGIHSGRSSEPPIVMYNSIVWGNGSGSAYDQINYGATMYSSTIQDGNEDGTYVYSGGVNPNITAYDCIDLNPQFVRDPNDGGDGWGVGDNDDFGNLRLSPGSPCIDDANNAAIPADSNDIDNDGNTTEPIPYDLGEHPRIVDGDCNGTDIVDMGAYEFSYAYMGDFDYSCEVDFDDFAILALAWLTEPGEVGWSPVCDISVPADNFIDMLDVGVFVDNWLETFP